MHIGPSVVVDKPHIHLLGQLSRRLLALCKRALNHDLIFEVCWMFAFKVSLPIRPLELLESAFFLKSKYSAYEILKYHKRMNTEC